MKKIIITERQLKMLKEAQQDSLYLLSDEFYDFEIEMLGFDSRGGSMALTFFNDKEQDYDYDSATMFEIEFEWESDSPDSSVGYNGSFGWYPTSIKMVQPEEKDIDIFYADMFLQDDKIRQEMDREIDKAFDKFDKDPY